MIEDLATEYGLARAPALALDEWTMRHLEPQAWPEPEPGADGDTADRDLGVVDPDAPGPLRVNRYSPRTLADALFYAGVFHGMHRLSGSAVAPRMANTVNLVNANAPLVVRDGGVVRAATYHVWDLYQNHTGPISLPATVSGPATTAAVRQGDSREGTGGVTFTTKTETVPLLDVSASTDRSASTVHLAVLNRHRSRAVSARISLGGRLSAVPPRAHVRDLGADVDDVLAVNRISDPDRVALRDRGRVDLPEGGYTFPPHSVTLLTLDL
jgi:alpha-N-arabinofuranosidase